MDDQDRRQPQSQPITPEQPAPLSPSEMEPATTPTSFNTVQPSPIAAPTPASTTEEPMVQVFPPQKPKRKGLIIGIIVGVMLVLGIAAACIYAFWYQNPDKVVTDGIIYAIKAKSLTYTGSMKITGDAKLSIELQGKGISNTGTHSAKVTFDMQGKERTIEAAALFSKEGDLYVKFSNVAGLVESWHQGLDAASAASFDKLVAKIDNQWVKISAKDLASFSEEASKQQTCTMDAMKKFKDDRAVVDEIAEVYKKNRFVIIDKSLGNKEGSLGYSLAYDKKAAKSFAVELKNTKIYKALKACDSSFEIDEKQAEKNEDQDNTHLEIWLDNWSHQITKITAQSEQKDAKGKTTLEWNPVFNQNVDVETPKQSTTLGQLQADIQEYMTNSMGNIEKISQKQANTIGRDISSEF